MALLFLWEVDHARPWPSTASFSVGVLDGFTKRLALQVAADEELGAWLVPRELQRPLAPGHPDSHHTFWPVQVTRPGPSEPQGWYEDFVARWRAYLATLTAPLGVATSSVEPTTHQGRPEESPLRVTKRRRTTPPERAQPGVSPAAVPLAVCRPAGGHHLGHSVAPAASSQHDKVRQRNDASPPGRPTKRQRDIRAYFGQHLDTAARPAAPEASRPKKDPEHGRARQGPPT